MSQKLYKHIQRFVEIDTEQFQDIFGYFEPLELSKKEILGRADERCDKIFFVLDGCLHSYFIDEKGVEKTVQFAIEDWWITDLLAFHHQRKAALYIQAVEESKVLSLSYESRQQLLACHSDMERYFREVYEISYGAAIMRVKYMFNYSKEEIFYQFRDQFPEFVNRVPQYLLATYLGLTPEYLSKLRGKGIS